MKLKRFLLRYYPPGLILEYQLRDGTVGMKEIDLLDLTSETDLDLRTSQIISTEPLLRERRKGQVRELLGRLVSKQAEPVGESFELDKVVRAHILPLTNCAFNKAGDKFVTGSYDRTACIFSSADASELAVLEGHKNVVYCVAWNVPYGDRSTGSFMYHFLM